MTLVRLKGLMSAMPVAQQMFYPGDKAPKPDFDPSSEPLEIRDARALQAETVSAAACFGGHGFVLLDHLTAVREWRSPPAGPDEAAQIYRPELDRTVRDRLFPGRRVEIDHDLLPLCRGGEDDAIYADWVHQDFGLTADDFARNFAGIATTAQAERWRTRYEDDEVAGCVVISFWRTIGMAGPLRHMPLALCDPTSVAMADVVDCTPASEGGVYHIGLRFDAGQRWYHYPGMRPEELLAFKLFECRKDDPAPSQLRSVFHSAFADPAMPVDAAPRQSCEYRAIVTVLRD